jgi:hypothetical protein
VDLKPATIESISEKYRQKETLFEQRISIVEKERDALNAEMLINSQIEQDKKFEGKDIEQQFKEEI